ncbi:cobalamin-binding protein [Spongorhabdus nitratireducens]
MILIRQLMAWLPVLFGLCFSIPALSASAPLRVITLSPHTTELVYAVGAGDLLVGTVESSDYPAEALELPRVGKGPTLSIEKIAALRPDLVFYWPSGNSPQLIEQLRQFGIRLEPSDPQGYEGVAADLRRIGKLLGKSEQGDRVANELLAGFSRLTETYQSRAPVKLFLEISHNPLISIGKGSFINQSVELCGGQNIFQDVGQGWPHVTLESILNRQPELIVTTDHNQQAFMAYWQQWADLQAVKNNRLYFIDPDLLVRQTPRLLTGATRLCEVLQQVRAGQ